jgi:CheY-like chemotaxis protein
MAKIAFDELRFVVVDDNAHMRRIVRTLLRAFGSREIYESEDGASGLEAVEAYSPDILITDIKMPIFDGIELTRMIRNPDGCRHPFLPIIILAAYSKKTRHRRARCRRDRVPVQARVRDGPLPADPERGREAARLHPHAEIFRPGPAPFRQPELLRRRTAFGQQ